MSSCGQIQVIFGPMFSGKTTELIRRLRRYQFAKQRCMVIQYAQDIRYGFDQISTHDGHILPAWSCIKLSDLQTQADAYDIIGIDEGQFFPDIVTFCDKMADQGKIVIVAALDGTFRKEGFGEVLHLVPLAENVTKLNAICAHCNKEAAFTRRKGSEIKIEIIGGAESYEAVCRKCFHLL